MAHPSPPSDPPSYMLDTRYLAEAHLARGETADTFRGIDMWSGERVAVRRLRADRAAAGGSFRRMSERLFGATSARLLRPIAMGDDRDGLPFLVSELLVGCDTERLGNVRWEVACELARQCAAAVAELHILGLHHGNLRPSTFFVCTAPSIASGSRVKLLDLGTGERSATEARDVSALVDVFHKLFVGQRTGALRRAETTPVDTVLRVNGAPPALERSLGRWLSADGASLTAAEMAAELLEIRNASHGNFWLGLEERHP